MGQLIFRLKTVKTKKMFSRIFLVLVSSQYVVSNSMDFTKTASVTVGSTTKTATCSISVSWSGGQLEAGASSVSCSIPWPKKKALDKNVNIYVVVGDVTDKLINVNVKFNLKKSKNNNANETVLGSWQDCAQLCSSYTNEAGNAPCFSWTYNNAGADVLGLPAGACRLLPYENVFRMDAAGVQSGYHKCWFAYSTSVRPSTLDLVFGDGVFT